MFEYDTQTDLIIENLSEEFPELSIQEILEKHLERNEARMSKMSLYGMSYADFR